MMGLYGLFDKDPVNTGRQKALDLGKALPILMLPFVHCFIECTTDAGLTKGIPYLFDSVIGGPFSAPMYMFAMGFGLVYTSKQASREFVRRGLKLIGFFYLLNICRFLIPYLIGYAISGDKKQFIEPLVYRALGNDVLCFAGFTFLVIALFRWLKIPPRGMFAIALAMSLVGTAVRGVDVHSVLGNIFLGYIVGTEDAAGLVISDFPIMNWLVVPVSGYVFGSYLVRTTDRSKFYALISPIPALIAAVYLPIGIRNEWGMFGEGQNCYYHISTWDWFICLCLTLGVLGIWHIVSLYLPPLIMDFFIEISCCITPFYCIHWVIVRTITNVILYIIRGTQILPVSITFFLSLAIMIVTIFLCRWWQAFKLRIRGAKTI